MAKRKKKAVDLASKTFILKFEAGPLIPLYTKHYGEEPNSVDDLKAMLTGLINGDLETIAYDMTEEARQAALNAEDDDEESKHL